MTADKNIATRDRLMMALDVPTADDAKEMVERLGDAVNFYKIGLELCMAGGYLELIAWLAERDKKVFADVKFFDVPATVGSAVRNLSRHGATFATVHGNDGVMEYAAANKGDMGILAVTVLTSLDRGDLDDLGFDADVEEIVLSRAKRAIDLGCDGVISSGLEVAKLRETHGHGFMVVTPGIRPLDNRPKDDQKRIVTPGQAIRDGADYIVVGRPIRDADDPTAAAEGIQAEIAEAVAANEPI